MERSINQSQRKTFPIVNILLAALLVLVLALSVVQGWKLSRLQAQIAQEQAAKAADEAKAATLKTEADAELVAFKERYKDTTPTVTGLQRFDTTFVTTFTEAGKPYAAVHFGGVWLQVPLTQPEKQP